MITKNFNPSKPTNNHSYRGQLVVICFTIAVDMFNLGLVYPLFTELIADPAGSFAGGLSSSMRYLLYSVMITAFPIGQFLGAPMVGRLSDEYGRRRLLIITVAGGMIGLALCALGLQHTNIWLLLFGRLFGGLMGANMSLAYAALADISTKENKVKNFALIPLMCGIGFTLGPITTGTLVTHNPVPLLGTSTPLWLAVIISGINLALVLKAFHPQPPVDTDIQSAAPASKFRFFPGIGIPELRRPLILAFLMISANFLIIQFIGPLGSDRFASGMAGVSVLYANLSISVALGHLFLTRRLANHYSPTQLLPTTLVILMAALIGIGLAPTLLALHLLLAVAMLACAVAYTNVMVNLSNHASHDRQGEVMGLGVSIQCLAEFLPPLLIGVLAAHWTALPLLIASALAGLGALLAGKQLAFAKSE